MPSSGRASLYTDGGGNGNNGDDSKPFSNLVDDLKVIQGYNHRSSSHGSVHSRDSGHEFDNIGDVEDDDSDDDSGLFDSNGYPTDSSRRGGEHSTFDTSVSSDSDNLSFVSGSNKTIHTISKVLRQCVISTFVYLAVIVPLVVYVLSRKAQVTAFEGEFLALSDKITESFSLKLANMLGAVDSLSVETTSYTSNIINATWPFVTLQDFQLRGSALLALSDIAFISFSPLVSDENRIAWEAYVENTTSDWLFADTDNVDTIGGGSIGQRATTDGQQRQRRRRVQFQSSRPHHEDRELQTNATSAEVVADEEDVIVTSNRPPPANTSLGFSKHIYRYDSSTPTGKQIDRFGGPYLPIWQTVPIAPNRINFNINSIRSDRYAVRVLLETGEAVLAEVSNTSDYDAIQEEELIGCLSYFLQEYEENRNSGNGGGGGDGDGDDGEDDSGSLPEPEVITYDGEPYSAMYYPIFDSFDVSTRQIVAVIMVNIFWQSYFTGILPEGANGIICVVSNECGDSFSIEVNGDGADFLGHGNLHDEDYDYIAQTYDLSQVSPGPGDNIDSHDDGADNVEDDSHTAKLQYSTHKFADTTIFINNEYCPYKLTVYPSDELHRIHITSEPEYYALAIFVAFALVSCIGMMYDVLVQNRMRRILRTAKQNRALVRSIFPETIYKQLIADKDTKGGESPGISKEVQDTVMSFAHPKVQLKHYLSKPTDAPEDDEADKSRDNFDNEDDELAMLKLKPIADLFPHCTVLFADISGFSAWSSEREPEQVFTLLESIFQTFDKLARRRAVFKVETIMDSYVAVTGLPDPQADHALRMTRYARDCLRKVNVLTKVLEKTLGPGTGDLRMRIGLHSGQVTAGVLRGQKSRFQLFGDTVNTASRMESTGKKNRIQLSWSTAKLLVDAGKDRWVEPREDAIHAKGKGVLQTFWLVHRARETGSIHSSYSVAAASVSSDESSVCSDFDFKIGGTQGTADLWGDEKGFLALPPSSRNAKNSRLVDWLADLLSTSVRQLIAERDGSASQSKKPRQHSFDPKTAKLPAADMVFDEVVEAFSMPKFDVEKVEKKVDPATVYLPPKVEDQIKEFVTEIAERYRLNPFHNFEHASHVSMSAIKLMKRIVAPEEIDYQQEKIASIAADLHESTFGITSDALAQFAVMFSSLIHDVDHTGVPNGQLINENPELGDRYKGKSVAEQNSVDISWDLLMEPRFINLQQCIFPDEHELRRFRQYIANFVMATDIFNKEMKEIRNGRWDKAFNMLDYGSLDGGSLGSEDDEGLNLKATIVLEHIIQAADVSHTMQHWAVYKRWNERLFQEMYAAYDSGRADKDPSEGWYKGEIWFFDNYIIPLGQKLEECGVFGVSSDECLNYALENRKEWALKGETVVKEMKERYQKRKMLEVGGFTPEEIEGFSAQDLEYILKRLVKKGRLFGTFQLLNKDGQRNATKAWVDALDIYGKSSCAHELSDRSLIFLVYSGVSQFVKGGTIIQSNDLEFEKKLAARFLRDAEHFQDVVHYTRAVALQGDILAREGLYDKALELSQEVDEIYAAKEHSEANCRVYGSDYAAQTYSQRALWQHQLEDFESSLETCDFIVDNVLKYMEPLNIMNTFDLLYPVIRIMKPRGHSKQMFDLLEKHVLLPFRNPEANIDILCRPLLKPLKMLLEIARDPYGVPEVLEDAIKWIVDDDKAILDDFLDMTYCRLGWAANTVTAELCLLVAKKLREDNGDHAIIEALVSRGLEAARVADPKMKDETGKVILPIPYEVHEPVMKELVVFGEYLEIPPDSAEACTKKVEYEAPLKTHLGEIRVMA